MTMSKNSRILDTLPLPIAGLMSTESGEAVSDRIRELAIRTFRVLECEGLGRVDCFLGADGEVIVNEINTIPGFTRISMYPQLWEATGITYPDLINRLIELAIERFEREQTLKTSY